MRPSALCASVCVVLLNWAPSLQAQDGAALYEHYCASCHDQVSPRIPPRSAIQKMSARRILRTLDFGLMMSIAYPLQRQEREAIATFLGSGSDEAAYARSAFCPDKPLSLSTDPSKAWRGWSPTFSNTRFQAAEAARLTVSEIPRLQLKWAFGFTGDVIAFGAPTVSGETLFTGSASGVVQALNAKTGCLYWTFQADGPVRAAPLITGSQGRSFLLFGDQIGWFYALEGRTGKLIWKRKVEEHEATRLTGSAAVYAQIVLVPATSWEETRAISPDYPCCTFRGSVTALRLSDGARVWKTYLIDAPRKTATQDKASFGPSGAGVWSAPTIDLKRGVLYVTTGDNYSLPGTSTSDAVVAIELRTGKILWSQQTTPEDVFNNSCSTNGPHCPPVRGPDVDFASSALLVSPAGRDLLVAGQKSGIVYAFDPDRRGEIVWQARVGKGGVLGGVQWGLTSDGTNVYAAVADAVRKQSNVVSAAPVGSAELDPAQGGGLTALRLADGARVWFAAPHPCNPPRAGCSPAQPGALSSIPGVVFSGSMDGHIRAFSTEDGNVLWDFDTARDYSAVNGVSAHGGSLDGAGPVIVDGMLYVNSGYPRFGGMPGNVLLAFSVDGK